MARKIKQFRYYNEDSLKNQPLKQEGEDLKLKYINGTIFDGYTPVSQLGIQSLPGTMFYLNGSFEPIIIGLTGIYEIDLDNKAEIHKIQIDETSLTNIENNETASLLIDIIYEEGI